MADCLIALGANLGKRSATLDQAVQQLGEHPQIEITGVSAWHETQSVGGPAGQRSYLNGAVRITTKLNPHQLLAFLQEIENRAGRERAVRWSARTLDLDLLLFGEQMVHTPGLSIPHPRMTFRKFVLVPAAEIAGEMIHPECGWTIASLLAHLQAAPRYIAITGVHYDFQERLAVALAERIEGACVLRSEIAARTGVARDCGSRDPAGEVEFLTEAGKRLRSCWAGASLPTDGWWVSDFWLAEALAAASTLPPADPQRALLGQQAMAARRHLPPRLLLIVDDFQVARPMEPAVAADSDEAAPVPYPQSLERLTMSGLQGPRLHISARDGEGALTEAAAAVAAMP